MNISKMDLELQCGHNIDWFGQRRPQVKTPKFSKLVNSNKVGDGDFGPSRELMWF